MLYFYPRDFTPGCTREACDFRANARAFVRAGIRIVGVSRDDRPTHARFAKTYRLPFELKSDPGLTLHRKHKAWGRKSLYGRSFMGTIRTTVLLDARGRVRKTWRKVKVDGHVKAVLDAARAL